MRPSYLYKGNSHTGKITFILNRPPEPHITKYTRGWHFYRWQNVFIFVWNCHRHWLTRLKQCHKAHYSDVILGAMASQITSLTIVCSTIYSGPDQRKHQNSASLAFVRGIHRWPVNSPHKWPVTRKMFPFDDVIMLFLVRLNPVQQSSISIWPSVVYTADSLIHSYTAGRQARIHLGNMIDSFNGILRWL